MRGFSSSRVEGKQFASLLLGKTELDLEGLGHLWGRGTGEAGGYLVVFGVTR